LFVEQPAELAALLKVILRDGDVLLTLGAGDIGARAAELGRAFGAKPGSQS
jgi:UDP-N-acetylmuramate--alanine ligase